MKTIFSILLTCLVHSAQISAQSFSIKGKVSTQSGGPIAHCSVFLNNTTRGTITDGSGEFELNDLPSGKHELVVSSIGYETYVQPFSEKELPLNLNVQLKQKSTELASVTIAPIDPHGWRKWGNFFIENFIGKTDFASDCKIRNVDVIKFRFSKKKNHLSAFASEPLIIENKALGYNISYQLEEFTADFNDHSVAYFGYPLFNDMAAKTAHKEKHWEKNRDIAYKGSVMHFMRALYFSALRDEGFTVRGIKKIPNGEKLSALAAYKSGEKDSSKPEIIQVARIRKDNTMSYESVNKYQWLLNQPDSIDAQSNLNSDDLVTLTSKGEHLLFFKGPITVDYPDPDHHYEFSSEMRLITPAPVQIEINGMYYPATEIFISGAWGYSEKVSNLLPMDYGFTDSNR